MCVTLGLVSRTWLGVIDGWRCSDVMFLTLVIGEVCVDCVEVHLTLAVLLSIAWDTVGLITCWGLALVGEL